jgi:ferredoxin
MPKKLQIDSKNCIGCTLCTQIAPNTFEMKDDGKSYISNPNGDSEDRIKQAAESCPVDAVKFE